MTLVILIGLSGIVLGRIYADDLVWQLVAGAALGSVGVSVAARRLPSWTVAPLSVVALAGYALGALKVAADRADLGEPLGSVVVDALVNGIPRLLTAMIPVEPTPDTVVVPVIAAWLAGLAGAEVAVRSGRVLLGILPAAALYGGALYVVGPNAGPAGRPTMVFAGLVALALAVSSRPPAGPSLSGVPAKTRAAVRGRTLAGATVGLVVLFGLIVAVGPWVGGRVSATPVDPRRYVEPPQVDSLDESPLNRISGWALAPEQKLLEAGPATGGKGAVRLRLAVLPDYDGVTWRVGATYRNAGRVLPSGPVVPGTPTAQVTQAITVDELTGRLLPVLPTPASIEGVRVAYDQGSGTLISPVPLQPGVGYSVTSQTQEPDLNLLPGADSPSGDAVARFLAVGAPPPEQLQRLADQLADGNAGSFDRAAAIEEFLAEHYRKVADAPSGHAYPNLRFFLFGPREQGGQRGTSEQFAASFAVLARLTGLPARVVVGFDVPRAGGVVTGGDAIAWPEVLFDDLGWVAFDPLPKSDDPPRPVEDDFTPKPPPPTSEPPPASEAPTASAPPVLAEAPAAGEAGPSGVLVASGVSGSVLLMLVAAAAGVVVLRRGLRQRRLGTGGPAERITGAWLEFGDALRLDGRPLPAHLNVTEAVAHAHAARLGGAAAPGRGAKPGRKAKPGREVEPGREAKPGREADLDRQVMPGGGRSATLDEGVVESAGSAPARAGVPGGPVSRSAVAPGPATAAEPTAALGPVGTSADLSSAPAAPALPPAGPGQTSADDAYWSAPSGAPVLRVAVPAEQVELPPLDALVAAVNTANFAPGAADAGQAEQAGVQVVAFADALRARRSWWRRVWWSVRPGPLRWHR